MWYCNKLFTRIDNMYVHQNKYCKNKLNQFICIDETSVVFKKDSNVIVN
jgi:hypothetical protein